ncbi:restriction endonuclease subunit S [Bacillus cereus]|uniref:restriction endonuclease subunit S n=1 Tax=Bacillus cereus TaxID=1396 RepID=UPI003D092782
MNEKLVPKRRFSGFTDFWEKCAVKEICSISTGKSNTQDKVDDGRYPFYVRSQIIERSNRYLYDEESVLTVGDGVGTGKVFHYVNGKYDLHQRVYRMFNFNSDILPKYFYYYFSNHFYQRVMTMTAKTSVDSVRYEMISEMNILFPSLEEQKRISGFIDYLDNLIVSQQKKLNKAKAMKSAYLSEMFPADGERKPKRRFAGYTEDWRGCVLGDLIEKLYNGQTPSRFKDENWNGEINWLSSGELNRGIVNSTIEKITDVGQKDANLKIVPKDTFVIAITGLEATGTRGNCAILGIDTTLNQSCMAIFPKESVLDSAFLFQWYRKVGEEYGIKYTQGTKQQSYNAELIKLLPITVPKIDEQKKIGKFFTNLDNLITSQQQKLDKLKDMKKAYLNEMFI